MKTTATVDALNQALGFRFGFRRHPSGVELPRFAWLHSSDVFLFVKDGTQTFVPPGKILAVCLPKYKRVAAFERFGDCWMMTAWQPPKDQAIWAASIGAEFPWSAVGDFYRIDWLPVHIEPDEKINERYIRYFAETLAKTESQIGEEARRDAERLQRESAAEFGDQIDDLFPAFDNDRVNPLVPRLGASRGGHVSFGGI